MPRSRSTPRPIGYSNLWLGMVYHDFPSTRQTAPTMSTTTHILPLAMGLALTLAGCGTYVPEIQEIPGDQAGGQLLVRAIARSIHCEIKDAVAYVVGTEPLAHWLLGWGAQMQITLTIDEQSSFSPSGLYSPMSIFSLLGGVGASAEATRIETLNYYYTVKDLYYSKACLNPKDIADSHSSAGSLLIQSDLKLRELLLDVATAQATGDISVTSPIPANATIAKNGITHEITFKVITNGNITPSWKLVRATINPIPPLFMGSRTRTHDLIITFGPNQTTTADGHTTNSLGPLTPAAGTFLAAQIGLATRNQMITGIIP
jgi:hypothetical protein